MEQENKKVPNLDFSGLSWNQLMELDSCTRCGQCLKWCPVYEFDNKFFDHHFELIDEQ